MLVLAADISDVANSIDKMTVAVIKIVESINHGWGLAEWGSAITTVLAFGVSVLAYRTSHFQRLIMKDQNDSQIFIFAAGVLRDSSAREARGLVYEFWEDKAKKWLAENDDKSARIAAASFETVFTVTIKSEWAREQIVENWTEQIIKCWIVIKPHLDRWRKNEMAPKLFAPFEELANIAINKEPAIAKRLMAK